MAINGYCGWPGSGKSYEVVTEVIVPAVAAGRRVVTNVEGIQEAEILAYLTVDQGLPSEKLGSVVYVESSAVLPDSFFYVPGREDTVTKPGDLVVLDECWRFFPVGAKLDPQVQQFLREHRHFTCAETGVAMDVVLIAQDFGDVDRKVRGLIEQTHRMVKLKMIGQNNRYKIEIYVGCRKVSSKAAARVLYRSYDSRKFAFYSSYNGKGAEVDVDGRVNVASRFLRVTVPLALVFIGVGGYVLWGYFHPKSDSSGKAAAVASSPAVSVKTIPASAVPDVSKPSGVSPVETVGKVLGGGNHEGARLVGVYTVGGRMAVVVRIGDRVRTFYDPAEFELTGLRVAVKVDGDWLNL